MLLTSDMGVRYRTWYYAHSSWPECDSLALLYEFWMLIQAGFSKSCQIWSSRFLSWCTKWSTTNHISTWRQGQDNASNVAHLILWVVAPERTSNNHIHILICNVYAIHQVGEAIVDLFLLNSIRWKLRFCENILNCDAIKCSLFPFRYRSYVSRN